MRRLLSPATLLAATASAQEPTTPTDSARRIPAVTITATRNAAPILTTPLAVTRVDRATLRATNGFGIDEALARVPGVVAQSRYGTSDVRLTIRGYGARGAGDRSNSGTTRGVRILLDGFPETEPDGRTSLDQLDLGAAESIEVIRSNASSVWGNAAGGVVNVVTMPNATAPSLDVQPTVGGFGLRRVALRSAAPIGGGDGVVWANVTNTSFDGWRDHSSAWRALLNGGAVGTLNSTRLGLFVSAANNLSHIPGPLTQAQVDADPTQANATYEARDERRWNRTGRLGVTVDHAFDTTTSLATMLYVNPKYLQRSERNTYRDFTRYHFGGNVIGRATRTVAGVRSRLTAGVDAAYQDGAILFYSLSRTLGRGTTLMDNKGEGALNVGLFAQNELAMSDRLSLLVGARWDDVSYAYRSFLPTPPVRADRKNFSRVSPRLGINWLLGSSHAIYANVGGGIEVPAGNETDPTPGAPPSLLNPLLDPIRSTTYEIGAKSSGGGPFGWDVALYDIEVASEIVPYNAGRYYLTAARARRQGAEVGANAAWSSGPFVSAAVTFSRNRYRDYVVDSTVLFPTDPTKIGKRADHSGHAIVGIPDAYANVEVGTTVPGLRAVRLKAGVELSDDYFADDANAVRVPGFALLHLTAELREPLGTYNGFGVRGFVSVRNVTDRRYVGSAFLNPDLVNGAPAAFEPGMPRAVVVSLSVGRLR